MVNNRIFFAALASLLCLPGIACAQNFDPPNDYPRPADMRPMGAIMGRYEGPQQVPNQQAIDFCKREAKKQFDAPDCLYVVNKSRYRIVGVRFSIQNDAAGNPVWSNNQFAPDFAFGPKRWTSWVRPKDWPCTVQFNFTFKVEHGYTDMPARGNFCDPDKLPMFVLPNPPRWTVTVEPEKPSVGVAPVGYPKQ